MGNEPSSERTNGTVTSPSKDAYRASVSPANTRRIVKAVKPTPSPGGPEISPEEKDNLRDEEDDNEDSKQRNRRSHLRDAPIPPHESPSIAREVELEKLKEQKQERLETMQTNQRLRREKRLDDRRKRNPQDGGGGDAKNSETSSQVQVNPFSKFLSVFSVEPKYPEHKRSYEVSEDDEPEPSVKKARASLENNDSTGRQSLLLTGAVTAAVLAIGVGIFLRASRSKI